MQNNLSKLLAAVGKDSSEAAPEDAEAEAEAEEGADIAVETTELPDKTEVEDEDVEDGDETMMTKLTGMPDAEGTRFMDYDDDEEDEDDLTPGNVKVKREPRGTEESLVESLLSDDEDTIS